jgi:type IV fimbrial biogenesis protein FimT
MNKPHTATCRPVLTARCNRGFSLIEVLVTLLVLSVLGSLSVVAFRSIGNSMKLTAATNSFITNLNLARSEAIKRNQRTVVCKSRDGVSCNSSDGWHQGWIVFHDSNNNGEREPGESVAWRVEDLPAEVRVNGNLAVSRYVSYSPTGDTKLLSGAFQAGTVTVCNQSLERTDARQIVLNAVGRVRVQRTTVDSCP